MSGEAVTLDINDIVRLEALQIRSSLDGGTVQRYASAYSSGADFPPITVARIVDLDGPEPVLACVDGFHRLAALGRIGRSQVDAIIIEGVSRKDAQWLSARANLSHGLPLKPKEVRLVFRTYVRTRQHEKKLGRFKSYRDIASDLAGIVSHTTVRRWMEADFKSIAERMGGNDHLGRDGGLRTITEATLVKEAIQHVAEAAHIAGAISDPARRGELVVKLEEILERLRARKHTRPVENDDF